jgi:Xaa-Pro aminopeptidase
MSDRVEKLLAAVKSLGAEAALLHSPENIRYFSGFTGEGCVFISSGARAVLTDSRYTEHAVNQARGFAVVEPKPDNFAGAVAALAADHGVKALGFEDDWLPVSQFEKLSKALPGIRMVPTGALCVKTRAVKDDEEIGHLRKACEITDRAFQYALTIIKPGMTEIELAVELKYYIAKHFSAPPSFEFIVASGPNGSMPHAVPTDRAIGRGELVTIDFGAEYMGYKADMTRTVAVGRPSDKMEEIYCIVLEAQRRGAEALAPGKACKAVDAASRDYIASRGYGANFGHGLGHGVGLQIHEQPVLNPRSESTLEPGMAVTVEPGVYLPGIGGVRIEDTCIITQNGWESLFASSKELIIL